MNASDKSGENTPNPGPAGAHPASPVASLYDSDEGAFFRRIDWAAFGTAFLLSLVSYILTLAPTVTLEDSGELAVAADYLGVPHPPGYPIWTLLAWLFQWVFHGVTYYGQPNPAWSVGLFSAVSGALACGLLALLVSRSGADMLRGMSEATTVLGLRTENTICFVSGVVGGLLFAFSSVLWSQSVIVEVYSLNALFFVLVLVLMYRWMARPREDHILYLTAFIFGLGLTNHQNLLFVVLGLMAAIWFRDRPLFRDCLAGLTVAIAVLLFFKAYKIPDNASAELVRSRNLMTTVGFLFLLGPVALFLIERKLMTEWRRVLIIGILAGLGLSFYAYMPFASEQNPPMNWGYPRTMEGFWHALSRGQYEKISPVSNLKDAASNPVHFFKLLNAIITNPRDYISVVSQFTWQVSLLALVPFFFIRGVTRRLRHWLITTLLAFLSLTVVFIIFQYPSPDVQTLFIGRVQYIQAHAVFALWISYGLVFLITKIDTLTRGRKEVKLAALLAAAALPLLLTHKNANDEGFISFVGSASQNGHDFGWQFGNYQLRGAGAIVEELDPDEPPLPNPNYPPEMGQDAVFFGGTDPGRFVPTYMIYSAKVRPDVYLITQNALADNTYMSVMRDLYGDAIWIPSQHDSNYAFQKYVQDVQSGKINAGAALSFQGGRVSVQGVQGVMMINGILARMIFEANKHLHPFYVEESYVIPWMYPYLQPHGLIMKINPDPLPNLAPEMIRDDRAFWDWYVERLLGNPKFKRDVVAQKTFSKLRSAIAGLYAYRRLYGESEHAFRQALKLYPLSPEANFRLADVFMQQRKFQDATELIETFLEKDPDNDKVGDYLKQIRGTYQANERRKALEQSMSRGADTATALELAELYRRLGMMRNFESLTARLIQDTNLPAKTYLDVGNMYRSANRTDLETVALSRYLQREPANPRVWVDLAAAQVALKQEAMALASLRRAIELGGETVRDVARRDKRFDALRASEGFTALVPQAASPTLPLNLPPMY